MKTSVKIAVLMVSGVLAWASSRAGAEGPRALSIKAVMVKQHRTSSPPFVRIKRELESDSPDWDKVRAATGDFAALCAALEKTEPRKGDLLSWKALTGSYLADAKAMDGAAAARDRTAALAAHRRLEDSCKTCHQAHRVRNQG